jgi:hypothetical protein
MEINRNLWKESLNSDGQQFHQYQLNELSPLTFTLSTKKTTGIIYTGNIHVHWVIVAGHRFWYVFWSSIKNAKIIIIIRYSKSDKMKS